MNPKSVRSKTAYKDSVFVSFLICILTLVAFLHTSDELLHWFLIPTTLCGILITIDAIDWFRGRLNMFDPVGIIGVLGFYFFFLAPLLHVSLQTWPSSVTHPQDWRPWVGGMAILNFLGLLVYRVSKNLSSKPPKNMLGRVVWKIDRQRFPFVLSFALIISAGLQILVYQSQGGVMGYITTVTKGTAGAFDNMGLVFMLSDRFPILAMIGFAVYAQRNKQMKTWPVLLVVLIVFLVLQILFGGLRGSRSVTVWSLFWAAGIVHLSVRRIPKQLIAFGLVFVVLFMYFYGFYKGAGLDALTAFEGQAARAKLEQKTRRTLQGLLLGDLSRSDVQAFVLYRIMRHDSDYEYAWGRTYFGTVAIMIPKTIRPERPPIKSKEGTEVQFGMGTYAPVIYESTAIYGLAGETMLNFGPFVVPFAFILLGIVVGRVHRWFLSWESSDSRLLLLPMLVNFCFIVLTADSDNILVFIFRSGSLPFLVIFMSSKRTFIPNPSHNSLGFYPHSSSEVRALPGISSAKK